MGSGLDRKETLRKPCSDCKTNGFLVVNGDEQLCSKCGGHGMILKEVPYKFDGERSQDEIDEIFAEE